MECKLSCRAVAVKCRSSSASAVGFAEDPTLVTFYWVYSRRYGACGRRLAQAQRGSASHFGIRLLVRQSHGLPLDLLEENPAFLRATQLASLKPLHSLWIVMGQPISARSYRVSDRCRGSRSRRPV